MKQRPALLDRLPFAAFAAATALAVGCGGADLASVTGRVVRSDGSALTGAQVIARSETGKSAVAATDQDGRFSLSTADQRDGIVPGNYNVIIMENRGPPDKMRPATIPAKYADPAQSGLSFSVQPGEEKVFDVTVESL